MGRARHVIFSGGPPRAFLSLNVAETMARSFVAGVELGEELQKADEGYINEIGSADSGRYRSARCC